MAAALQVANADDGGGGDRGMTVENALDVVRSERPAVARDDVLGAPDEREVAFLVDVRDITGQVPVTEEGRLRLLGLLPVAGEERRWPAADGEVALDPGRKLVALVVDDRHVMARDRAPERSGLDGAVGEVRDDDVRLGLAVAVRDGQAPALLEDGDDLGVEEVTRGDETP